MDLYAFKIRQFCDVKFTVNDPPLKPMDPTDTSGLFILFVIMNLVEGKLVIDPVFPLIVATQSLKVIESNMDNEPILLPIVGRSTIQSAESISEA